MYEHLHVLISAQIERGIAIDSLRLALRQILGHHHQCLLVGLGQLWLRGVGDTRDAWGYNIVDGALVVVLLDVDGTDCQGTAIGRTCQLLVIDAPVATHQFKRAETQHDGLAELGEEHTHEADAGEVADAPYPVLVL